MPESIFKLIGNLQGRGSSVTFFARSNAHTFSVFVFIPPQPSTMYSLKYKKCIDKFPIKSYATNNPTNHIY
jgi:hypothetical protein